MLVLSFLCEDRRGILFWAKFRLQQERKEMLPEDVTEGEKKRQKKNGNQASLDNRRTIHFGSIPYIFPSLLLPSPQ